MSVVYQTLKAIENPNGDGRHNRAPWRSPLDKTTIPAGFVFAVDDEGNIEDRSRPVSILPAERAAELRNRLLKVASPLLAHGVSPVQEETAELGPMRLSSYSRP